MVLFLKNVKAAAQEETSHHHALGEFAAEFGDFAACKVSMIEQNPHKPSALSSLILSAKMPEPA